MDREEALQLLQAGPEGIRVWNLKKQQEAVPDLSGCDLSQSDLRGADLSQVQLKEANLRRALLGSARPDSGGRRTSLRCANLQGALLEHAQLHYTDLTEANLESTEMSGAYLTGAILHRANLRKADLFQAHFNEADLSGSNCSDALFIKADLRKARFHQATLCFGQFREADLRGAVLSQANLSKASLHKADLSGARLDGAILVEADLSEAKGAGAILRGSWLTGASLVRTDFQQADLTGCSIYGTSAWDVQLEGAIQADLVVSPLGQPTVTVDNLEVAQFIYLLLNNQNVRRVIDTITSTVVLILGRFTPERKAILDAFREELRRLDYLPILFDFDKPSSRDFTETISTLAHLARFILADVTEAKSIPQELQAIVPNLPSVPVQPLLESSSEEYGMFEHFRRYPWVLPLYRYRQDSSFSKLTPTIIAPAIAMSEELRLSHDSSAKQ